MISIAILGFGNIGGGTAEVLTENKAQIEKYIGSPIRIKYILDLRDFPDSPYGSLVTHDFNTILDDPEVSIVAEMMGGSHPAYDFTRACLEAGKNVVTSNKEVVAKFGSELLDIAASRGVRYMFEASVGGGIPIIRPMINDLSANGILAVSGILNGTTNYILTRMENEGVDYPSVLSDAQSLGYAERNPAADVEGTDSARKIVILAAIAYGRLADSDFIHKEGITDISLDDIKTASASGCAVKLIAHAELIGGRLLAMVSPRFVALSSPLYAVREVNNGILVEGDMIGRAMFFGPGAGRLPTASAVVADIADIAANINTPPRSLRWEVAGVGGIADFAGYACRSCFILKDGEEAERKIEAVFGKPARIVREGGRISFISESMSEAEADKLAARLGKLFIKRFRYLA